MMNLLIILGCLAGGYWLVSSIMSPGVDLTRTKRPEEKPAATGAAPGSDAHRHDWHLILDIPANANRREIEHAYKRRLAKAESAGDSIESQRIRDAYAAGLRQAGR
jgi:hypothetical protein